MDGAERLALRRKREARAPAVLRGGFRPFFLASAFWFLLAMMLWLGMLSGGLSFPAHFDRVAWHRHELIFGGAGAAMAGYLLTATPNWSGRLPAIGMPLLALVAWWTLARISNALAGWIGPWPAAALDTGFFLALTAVCGREIFYGNGRGKLNVALVALFSLACGAHHLGKAGLVNGQLVSERVGIAILVILISLIGGKLVPSFTRNAMARAARTSVTAQDTLLDAAANLSTCLGVLLWLTEDGWIMQASLVIAGLLQLARATRWQPWSVMHEPSVLALHVAYAWLPIGLFGLAFADHREQSDAVHLLTAGAVSCMILAVMARTTITQTGRRPRYRNASLAAVLFTSAGAGIRYIAGSDLIPVLEAWYVAGVMWMLGFTIFLLTFGPILLLPRAGKSD